MYEILGVRREDRQRRRELRRAQFEEDERRLKEEALKREADRAAKKEKVRLERERLRREEEAAEAKRAQIRKERASLRRSIEDLAIRHHTPSTEESPGSTTSDNVENVDVVDVVRATEDNLEAEKSRRRSFRKERRTSRKVSRSDDMKVYEEHAAKEAAAKAEAEEKAKQVGVTDEAKRHKEEADAIARKQAEEAEEFARVTQAAKEARAAEAAALARTEAQALEAARAEQVAAEAALAAEAEALEHERRTEEARQQQQRLKADQKRRAEEEAEREAKAQREARKRAVEERAAAEIAAIEAKQKADMEARQKSAEAKRKEEERARVEREEELALRRMREQRKRCADEAAQAEIAKIEAKEREKQMARLRQEEAEQAREASVARRRESLRRGGHGKQTSDETSDEIGDEIGSLAKQEQVERPGCDTASSPLATVTGQDKAVSPPVGVQHARNASETTPVTTTTASSIVTTTTASSIVSSDPASERTLPVKEEAEFTRKPKKQEAPSGGNDGTQNHFFRGLLRKSVHGHPQAQAPKSQSHDAPVDYLAHLKRKSVSLRGPSSKRKIDDLNLSSLETPTANPLRSKPPPHEPTCTQRQENKKAQETDSLQQNANLHTKPLRAVHKDSGGGASSGPDVPPGAALGESSAAGESTNPFMAKALRKVSMDTKLVKPDANGAEVPDATPFSPKKLRQISFDAGASAVTDEDEDNAKEQEQVAFKRKGVLQRMAPPVTKQRTAVSDTVDVRKNEEDSLFVRKRSSPRKPRIDDARRKTVMIATPSFLSDQAGGQAGPKAPGKDRPKSGFFFARGPSIREVIEKVQANDAATTSVSFANSPVFQGKADVFCALLCKALKTNTTVTSVDLTKCGITDVHVRDLCDVLACNKTLTSLNLQENGIGSPGAINIANVLEKNDTLLYLTLLNQKHVFGDLCLQAFIDMFEHNITLLKITWRLDSRKSFAINKLIVRNNDIARRKDQGREYNDILPKARQA